VLRVIQQYSDTDMNTWDMIQLGPGLLIGWPNRNSRVLEREDLIATDAGWTPNYGQVTPWIQEHYD